MSFWIPEVDNSKTMTQNAWIILCSKYILRFCIRVMLKVLTSKISKMLFQESYQWYFKTFWELFIQKRNVFHCVNFLIQWYDCIIFTVKKIKIITIPSCNVIWCFLPFAVLVFLFPQEIWYYHLLFTQEKISIITSSIFVEFAFMSSSE